MHQHYSRHSQTKSSFGQYGYVLPLVIITGMILVVGAAIISARSFSGIVRWGQQKHRDEAIEIAEAGVAIILNKLNNDYPYLLVEDCDLENSDCSAWNTQTVSVKYTHQLDIL